MPPMGVQFFGAGQFAGEGELVDGLVALEEGEGGGEAELVALAVEVFGLGSGGPGGRGIGRR